LDRILLLNRVSRLDRVSGGDYSRCTILRGKLSLGGLWVCRRIRSSGDEVGFSDVAIPNTGVASHMLPNDEGEDGDVVEEH
jgi:hypothetical protein